RLLEGRATRNAPSQVARGFSILKNYKIKFSVLLERWTGQADGGLMDHRSLHAFFFGVVIAWVQSATPPQDLQFPVDETSASRQRRLYNEAKPYLNDSLSELQKTMPELRGLKADEKDLPALLTRVGQEIEELSLQMPNLISSEEVIQTSPGSRSGRSNRQQFNYL